MGDAAVMRVMDGQPEVNTLVLRYVTIRFQIAPGTTGSLGIANAAYTVTCGGRQLVSGTTNADGEVSVPVVAPELGTPVLRILETDYNVSLHPGLGTIDTLAGQQKRLDHLGYLTGYQLVPIADNVPDDGTDGTRTQQSIMNFQTDTVLTIDGDIGANTKTKLTETMGGV